ncbi:TasA family protein [Archaeoglobus fulgidus]|jgi:predicted ribosomally synthesized peptide with SipW-like signal peptide|uniref:Uncharacterized protein n=2 Tax=Archaeoglobus fulgidus TaxID=2234 RepID=O28615_ARCFU|nr:TasA family protein [Archaeoglobus fulgidus]AAB89613.1 predicted coding region AF_1658 [Archaeoglobus fulgidus DSM 4304]KUJ93488.1 MAG: hypothetical protein XD40_1338 [Archaeoglobus fulgidus]KUK05620.1 MAG: hypothetical protein XD48_2142 [Archaeoglobus fulgidus]
MRNYLIFFSISLILFAGSTLAYFSDAESSPSTYTTGYIDLKVWQNGWVDNPGKLIDIEAKPCEYKEKIIRIKNAGNNPAVVDLKIFNVRDFGGVFTEEEARFDYLNEINNISYQTFTGIWVECESFSQLIVENDNKTLRELEDLKFYTSPIAPGEVCDVHFTFHINSSAENEYQGDLAKFDLELSLEQVDGNGGEEETCWAIGGDFHEFGQGWGGYFTYTGGGLQVPIYAGRHIHVGSLTVEDAGGKIRVKYSVNGGWMLTETHLYVGDCPPPKSAPGKFPYKHEGLNSNFDEYVVDYGNCIAAHGVVVR